MRAARTRSVAPASSGRHHPRRAGADRLFPAAVVAGALAVALTLAGCGGAATSGRGTAAVVVTTLGSAPTAPPESVPAGTPDPRAVAVDITLTGAVEQHLTTAVVTCVSLAPHGGPLLAIGLSEPGPAPPWQVQIAVVGRAGAHLTVAGGEIADILTIGSAPGVAPTIDDVEAGGTVRLDPGLRSGSLDLRFDGAGHHLAATARGSFRCSPGA